MAYPFPDPFIGNQSNNYLLGAIYSQIGTIESAILSGNAILTNIDAGIGDISGSMTAIYERVSLIDGYLSAAVAATGPGETIKTTEVT